MLPIEVLILSGASEVYFSVAEHGWLYLLGSVFAVLAVAETSIYWIHRALHTRFLYRHLHVFHHRFREPTPLASLAFHPLDSFAQALPYHICALLFPLHVWVYNGFVTLVTIWAVMIHDRIRWTPLSFVNHAGCHTAHHWYFRYNYGQFFTFWDRLCGTYHSPADLPERFRLLAAAAGNLIPPVMPLAKEQILPSTRFRGGGRPRPASRFTGAREALTT